MLLMEYKPLVGMVKTANLDTVGNHYLLRMLESMLCWIFTVTHLPGKKDQIPIAMSWYPWEELAVVQLPTDEEV